MLILVNFLTYWIFLPWILVILSEFVYPPVIPSQIIKIIGFLLTIGGFFYAMLASGQMYIVGRGLPIRFKPPKKLITCGLFSICRNPVYLGFFVFISGILIYSGQLGGILILPIFYIFTFLWTLLVEEKELEEKYEFDYKKYFNKTPRFLPLGNYRKGNCPSPLYILLFYFNKIFLSLFLDIEIESENKIPENNFIVIANHANFLDPLIITFILKRYIKFSVSYIFYKRLKTFMKHMGVIPIFRHKADPKAVKSMIKAVNKGNNLGIFPEGTRSWDGRPGNFHYGISRFLNMFNKKIVAVRLKGNHDMYPRWSSKFLNRNIKVKVEIKVFDNPEFALNFINFFSTKSSTIYFDYRGVEKYIYLCPECGSSNLYSNKTGFGCYDCNLHKENLIKKDLWKIHDSILDKVSFPIKDQADLIDVFGKKIKGVIITYDGEKLKIRLDNTSTITFESIKNVIIEGRDDLYLYNGKKLFGLRLTNSSALKWKLLLGNT